MCVGLATLSMLEKGTSSILTAPPLASSVKNSSLDPVFRKDEQLAARWDAVLKQQSEEKQK